MPEGDTIFRTARTLNLALAGHEVTRFETAYAHLQRVHDETPIVGRRVASVASRGKHVLMTFSGSLVLRTHMRMSGSWHVYRPGERWKLPRALMRILVATEGFEAVAFSVQDTEWVAGHRLERGVAGRLGPDLLADEFDLAEALRRLRTRDADPIGVVLLDQRLLAGIGNVYKSEILFLARVHPWTPTRALDDETLAGVVERARRLLAANVGPRHGAAPVARGGWRRTTGRDQRDANLWVYERQGQPCRVCGSRIERSLQGPEARGTWWCPTCQPEPTL